MLIIIVLPTLNVFNHLIVLYDKDYKSYIIKTFDKKLK